MEQLGTQSEGGAWLSACSLEAVKPGGHGWATDQTQHSHTAEIPTCGQPGSLLGLLSLSYTDSVQGPAAEPV